MDTSFVEGLMTEVSFIRENDDFALIDATLDTAESLSPGCIVSPCFDVAGSPSNFSYLTERRSSYTRTLHHSSGCISEIRASTLEFEVVTTKTEHLQLGNQAATDGDFFTDSAHGTVDLPDGLTDVAEFSIDEHLILPAQENVSEIVRTSTSSSKSDILDANGSFDVTCTSNYLPKPNGLQRTTSRNFYGEPEVVGAEENGTTPTDDDLDYTQVESWRNQPRQFFILSDSGKPIYSRHGEEDKLVTLCGVMSALVSVVNDTDGNNLWSINALGTTVSFLVRTPLIVVTEAKTDESDRQLLVYLTYTYDFIISVLTLPQLSKIFLRFKNFDLRRMLAGTEKILDHLIDWFDEDMGFLLGSVRCLPLPTSLRDSISSQLTHSCHKIPGLVFAIIIAKRQLISVTRLKKYVLHPCDIRLLINLVDASDSFKTAESWIPICLPKFDSSGFLHAYISYVRETSVCLIYLAVDPHLFHALAKSSASFSMKMESSGNLQSVLQAMSTTSYYSVSQCGVPELRHFVYKSTSAAQLTSPCVTHPYLTVEGRRKLRDFYRYLHRRMHCPVRAAKIVVVTSNKEMLLGWVTAGFELYAVLEPSITKHHAVLAIEKLIKWIKKEENHLFILSSPVFA